MWFKKKEKNPGVNFIEVMVDFIKKTRQLKWTQEEIIKSFKDKKYPDEWILQAFQMADNLNNTKEEKMAEYEDDELDTSEITDDDSLEEAEQEADTPEPKPKPVARQQVRTKQPVKQPAQDTTPADRFEPVYQRELSGVLDRTTGQVNPDMMALLSDILNRLERIEQSL